MPLKTISKTVTSAGTAERLSSTDLLVWWARVKAKTANAGTVYLGDAAVSSSDLDQMSAYGYKRTLLGRVSVVRFTPNTGHRKRKKD